MGTGGRGWCNEFQPGAEFVHDQAVGVGRARHYLGAVRGQHRPGNRVAGYFHPDEITGPQHGGGDQAQPCGNSAGDQELVRGIPDAAGPPQVGGKRAAQFRKAAGSAAMPGGWKPADRQARRQAAGSTPAVQGMPGRRSITGGAAGAGVISA